MCGSLVTSVLYQQPLKVALHTHDCAWNSVTDVSKCWLLWYY